MKLPKVQMDGTTPNLPYNYTVPKEKPFNVIIQLDTRLKNHFVVFQQVEDEGKKYKTWGNGRDWRRPRPREGGWVRIWPFNCESKLDRNNNVSFYGGNMGVKAMVSQVGLYRYIALAGTV